MRKVRTSNFKKLMTMILMCILVSIPMIAEAAPKLNKTEVTIQVGEKVKLKVKNTAKNITWSTSDKTIATVNQNGAVKGKSAGEVTITAKVGKKKLECEVTVTSGSSAGTSRSAKKSGTKSNTSTSAKSSTKSSGKSNAKSSSGTSGSGGSGIYYWTPYGKSYHSTRNCPTLSRSRTVYSGSLSACPKSDPCDVCCK